MFSSFPFSFQLLLFVRTVILCVLAVAGSAHAADDYLDPEAAFKFSARMIDPKTIEVSYAIADGYYMYRERFAFKAQSAALGQPVFPSGKVKFDETFRKEVETYRKNVTLRIPVDSTGPFKLTVTSQGCADKGLCYTPMDSEVTLSPAGGTGLFSAAQSLLKPAAIAGQEASSNEQSNASPPESEMGRIESSLRSGRLVLVVPLFILLGLGLAFTPCVLPMVPILSVIIVGEGAGIRRSRAFLLSVAYSFGMAIVYTALGISAGLIGEGLSASLQNPWVLSSFAAVMVILSLSMFNVYQLQIPAALQTRLMQVSGKQPAGKMIGVVLMGAISALIVGPCVAAPLAGALVYISQTRDVLVGGTALFAMAVGMSIPLLLVGLSAGTLLPRAGAWMVTVKKFFGVLMLGMALWMISPVIPGWTQMLGWSVLGSGAGLWLIRSRSGATIFKLSGAVLLIFGLTELVGLGTGGRDPLSPIAHLTGQPGKVGFKRVSSIAELDSALLNAGGKPAMLDFYADWCVSCKEMEKLTFSQEPVQAQLAQMVLLQVDVTANSADDKALLKRFGLFGPPGIIFFDRDGQEVRNARVIGFQPAREFLQSLNRASSPAGL